MTRTSHPPDQPGLAQPPGVEGASSLPAPAAPAPSESSPPPPPPPSKGSQAISRRITRMAMWVCFTGLLMVVLVLLAFDLYSHYQSARSALVTLTRVAGENVRTPLQLRYIQIATASLDAITAEPDITAAAVYHADGQLFALSTKPGRSLLTKIQPGISGTERDLPLIRHYEPITYQGKRLGTMVVESTLAPLQQRLKTYGIVTGATLILAWAAARLLAERLQRGISGPIVELAVLADQVATGRDYSLRAVPRARDEVGDLVVAFNKMLSEIERRDEAIHQSRMDLEMNVLARTSELHQQIEDRKLAQSALRDSEGRYRSLFESNPMPLMVVDLETLDVIAVNNAAMRHYGYTEAEFLRLSLPSITYLTDSVEVFRALRAATKSVDAGEWKHRTRQGGIIEVHLTAHPMLLGDRLAKIVLANDVTERNRTQRELGEMHKKLLDASRQAGMAEVATGVLHNVGNVLNSVNVSANVLAEQTQQSKANGIRRVAELFQNQAENLAAFLSPGGKGEKLPQYLLALASQVEAEQRNRLSELEQLVKNVEHIKEIVLNQQDYAKGTGVIAPYAAQSLAEDALKMAEVDLAMEHIQTTMEISPDAPAALADRHKVLQILLNLLTNARQAMETVPTARRQIRLRVSLQKPAKMVRISVQDSGCGIAPENLTRIFNHGFTTKRTGHGFGLHSSANAAREMHGSLTVESSPKGSTFHLDLPIASDPNPSHHFPSRT